MHLQINTYFTRERQWFILTFTSTFVQREIRRLVFETWFSPFHFHGCAANAGHAEQALNFLIGVSDEGRREGRSRKGREKQRVARIALLLCADENPVYSLVNQCEKDGKEKIKKERWKKVLLMSYFLSIVDKKFLFRKDIVFGASKNMISLH